MLDIAQADDDYFILSLFSTTLIINNVSRLIALISILLNFYFKKVNKNLLLLDAEFAKLITNGSWIKGIRDVYKYTSKKKLV